MNFALRSALSHFKQHNGELVLGNRTVSSIAEEYGTPLYVYDRSVMARRQELLRNVLPSNVQVYYSVKANPNPQILQIMGKYYNGADISSKGEMQRAIEAGISQTHMCFTGPGKSNEELKFAIQQHIGCISIESEREAAIIQSICEAHRHSSRILVRVNPPFDLPRSGMKMGGHRKPFGVDFREAPRIISRIKASRHMHFSGVHIFSGSQNLHADRLLSNFNEILNYAFQLSESSDTILETVNIGGGFGIPYFAHEKDLDIRAVGEGLKNLLKSYEKHLTQTTVRMELGRFIIGPAGVYVSRVLYRKKSFGTTFLVLDGGMHHHLAASGNFGQSLVRRPMPLTSVNKLDKPIEKVSIVGPLCTPLDTFGTVDIPHAEEGDLIGVFNSGAYGYSASPLEFISRPKPKEVVLG